MLLKRAWNRVAAGARRSWEMAAARGAVRGRADLTPRERDVLDRIVLRVDRQDEMYRPSQAHHYLGVGLSAVRCVERSLGAAGSGAAVRSILDFACGRGRVLRFLKARFPDAALTGAEIEPDALAFCRRAFGIRAVRSSADLGSVRLDGPFDLIWCGSLVTHLSEAATLALLRLFRANLAAGGVCVFTTHGQSVVERLHDGYLLPPQAAEAVRGQYAATGYGYADYPGQAGYGVSVVSRTRAAEMCREVGGWDEVLFAERGWDNHQDVYALRASRPRPDPGAAGDLLGAGRTSRSGRS